MIKLSRVEQTLSRSVILCGTIPSNQFIGLDTRLFLSRTRSTPSPNSPKERTVLRAIKIRVWFGDRQVIINCVKVQKVDPEDLSRRTVLFWSSLSNVIELMFYTNQSCFKAVSYRDCSDLSRWWWWWLTFYGTFVQMVG